MVAPRVQQVHRLPPGDSNSRRLAAACPRPPPLVRRPILDDGRKPPLPALRVGLLRGLVHVDGDAEQAGEDEELDLAPPEGRGPQALAVGRDPPLGQLDRGDRLLELLAAGGGAAQRVRDGQAQDVRVLGLLVGWQVQALVGGDAAGLSREGGREGGERVGGVGGGGGAGGWG